MNSNCVIKEIETAAKSWWQSGLWLVLLHPEQKPPHLGLFCNGAWYSLTNKGVELGQAGTPFVTALDRKHMPLLALKLSAPELAEATVRLAFEEYSQAGAAGATCLYPIRDVAARLWAVDASEVNYIFDLVPKLQTAGVVLQAVSQHLEPWMDGKCFTLTRYTRDEILARIRALNQPEVPC